MTCEPSALARDEAAVGSSDTPLPRSLARPDPPIAASSDGLAKRFEPFQTAPTGMLLADSAGRVVLVNQKVEHIFGYQAHELLGRPVETLIPPDNRERHSNLRQAYSEYPVTRQMGASRDLFGLSKAGQKIPVEIGLTTFEHDGRQLVLAFVIDLTERKKQEEKLRLVAEAATNGQLMIDSAGRVALANGAACSIFGYRRDELIGLSIDALVPDRFRTKHEVYRGSFMNSPETRAMGVGRDLFARRKNGSEFPVEIGLTPVDAHDGKFVVATIVDITERKAVEAEIRSKNAALSKLNDELLSFAYSVSHDLKAPLLSVRGLADQVIEDLNSGESAEARQGLTRISREVQDLAALIERVLELAKSDHSDEACSEVDLTEVATRVVETLEPFASRRGVTLATEVEPDLKLRLQPDRLLQTLENLVANGVKYSDDSKPDPFVELSATANEGRVELSVQDNGIGIPAECRDQVFGMFRRFHGQRGDGCGLGLALVKKHVDRMGGAIDFESSPAGTRFRLSFKHKDELKPC